MIEFERSITVQAPPDQVFAFVSDVQNLPKYLPTVHSAVVQQGERVRVEGEARGHEYNDDGFYRVNQAQRRMEWGSDGDSDYSGWLEVQESGDSASIVTVYLSFEPSGNPSQQTGDYDKAIQEGLADALQSIQNIIEGQGGKVE